MGNLPECKLEPGMVFRNSGDDFFGPMISKKRRSEVKMYGCSFVCMAKLELAILNWWTIYQRISSLWL